MAAKSSTINAIHYTFRNQNGILLYGGATVRHVDSFKALSGTFGKNFQVQDPSGMATVVAGWFFTQDMTNQVTDLLQRINSGEEQGKKLESKWAKAPAGMENVKLTVPVPGATDTFNLMQGERTTPLTLVNLVESNGVVTQVNLRRDGDNNVLFAVPTMINSQPYWIMLTSAFEWGTLQIIKTIGTQQPFDPNVVGAANLTAFN